MPHRPPAPALSQSAGALRLLQRPDGAVERWLWRYLYLSSPQTTFMLKIDTRPSIAALHEPLGVAAHAVRRSQPKLGSTVVVQGSGAIGLFTLGLARLAGATRAIVVGGPAERLELAQAFGADVVINIDELRTPEERTRVVLDETPGGLGADVVYGVWARRQPGPRVWGICVTATGGSSRLGSLETTGRYRGSIRPHSLWPRTPPSSAPWDGRRGLPDRRPGHREPAPAAGQVVSHQLPLAVWGRLAALNGDYRLDGRTAVKIAIAPNGSVP